MAKLTALLDDARRDALIADVVAAVERHVAQRSGVRGVALRATLAAVHRLLPDAIPRTVTRLLPDFVTNLEPFLKQSGAADGREFARYLTRDRRRAAEALLGVADARVERSTNAALKTFYKSFRSTAEREAEGLVPALADVLAKHLQARP
jgi:hypothetical protein